MKVYTDDQDRIIALEACSTAYTKEYEVDRETTFGGMPDVEILCYKYTEQDGVISVAPFVTTNIIQAFKVLISANAIISTQLSQADDAAIELYEGQLAIQEQADSAVIELYELYETVTGGGD